MRKRRNRQSMPLSNKIRNDHGMNRIQMWQFRFALILIVVGLSVLIWSWNERNPVGFILGVVWIVDNSIKIYRIYLEASPNVQK